MPARAKPGYGWLPGDATALAGLIDALFAQVNPIPIKKAMNFAGWRAGPCRLPLIDPSEKVQRLLRKEMQRLGISILDTGGEGR